MGTPVRITCDPMITTVVLVIGEGPNQISLGFPPEEFAVMMQQAATACALIAAEQNRERPQ